jgi:hypothetical protein
LCNQDYEDEWHVFFSCVASIQARQSACLDSILELWLQQCNNVHELIHVGAQELKMMTKGITAQNERMKKVVLMIATTRLFIQKQKCHIGPNKV